MSSSEIQYIVPKEARGLGDTEAILNAMGSYQQEVPFLIPQEVSAAEVTHESVFLRLTRTTRDAKPRYELLETSERMRRGVEKHFSDEDRARLSKHFVGIAIVGATETE